MINKLNIEELRDKIKLDIMKDINDIELDELPNEVYIISTVNDDASKIYMRNKIRAIEELGLKAKQLDLSENCSFYKLSEVVNKLVYDNNVLGIIIQKPLHENLKPQEELIDNLIPRRKDIDQISIDGASECCDMLPCTVWGVMEIIDYMADDLLRELNVLVIGRSKIVGRPLVDELVKRGATVMSANSKTSKATLKQMFELADIVVSAVGKPKIWGKNYFHKYQLLIDVGINRDENGKLCGDFDVSGVEEEIYYTPVPKGVGIMTVLGVQNNILGLLKIAKGVMSNESI